MPTFGQVADYPLSSASTSDKTAVSLATPSSSGTVDTAVARIWMTAGSTTAKFCIYADSGGAPGAKLAESDPLIVTNTGEQEVLFTFSGANRIQVVSGAPYWLGPSWRDPGADSLNISRNSTTGGRCEASAYAPDPFGTATSLTGPIDAYVNYLLPVSSPGADSSFFTFFDAYAPPVSGIPNTGVGAGHWSYDGDAIGDSGAVTPATMVDATNVSFTDSGGLSGTYHIYGSGLTGLGDGLVVHLHGDEAYEFLNPTDNYCLAGNRGMISVAKAKGYALLVPKAPDTTGAVTWWEAGARNAQWLAELMQHMYNTYNINNGKVWLVGYSGGAQQITERFVPLYGKAKIAGGGALLLGGGAVPISTPVGWDGTFKAAFPMYWVTGGQDDGTYSGDGYDALADATAGKTYYAGQGFTTTQATPPGIGHEIDGAFGPILDDLLPTLSGYSPPSRTPGTTRPTLVTSYLVTGTGVAITTTPSFTPSAGEVIVVKAWNADYGSPNIGGVTGGGRTYATKSHIQATGKSEAWQFVAEVGGTSPGAMTVSVSWFGTSGQHGIIVERWSSGLVKGVPAHSSPVMGSGAPSASITPENANSVITWLDVDWNVASGTAAYRSSATQTQQSSTSNVRAYAARQNSTGTGAQTVGLTAPTGQSWSMGAIELLPAP